MKRIVLHIGAHKTASTYLQAFLHTNHEELAKHGFLYPRFDQYNNYQHHRYQTNGRLIDHKKLKYKVANELAKFDQSNCQTCVLSEENLFWNSNNHLYEFIETYASKYKIEVIFYLRDCIDYFTSFWKFIVFDHTAKGKPAPVFDDIILADPEKSKSHTITRAYKFGVDCLEHVSQLIGTENIQLRPFTKNSFTAAGIETDFLKAIDCDARDFAAVQSENASPTLKQAELLAYANQSTSSKYVLRECISPILQLSKKSKATLSIHEIDTIYENQKHYQDTLIQKYSTPEITSKAFELCYADWLKKAQATEQNRQLSIKEKSEVDAIIQDLSDYESKHYTRIRMQHFLKKIRFRKYSSIDRAAPAENV